MDPISICLCDSQPVVRQGLEAMLSASGDFCVTAFTDDIEQTGELAAEQQPAILILDRGFGMQPALEALAEVRTRSPQTAVVLWASSISDVECFRALQAGARGIMKKTIDEASLLDCLRSVSRNELWTENLSASDESSLDRPRSRPLTPREKEVAALVSKGLKNREIAEQLGIATGTVKIHLMHIFEKTGIRDRFELALQGLRIATEREAGREHATSRPETVSA